MQTSKLDHALQAIADGTPVPWDTVERGAAPTTDEGAAGARILDDVARAFRESTYRRGQMQRPPPRFRWGTLEVDALLGEGSYGEVHRAFDPWLGRTVALKLFRDSAGSGLDEARRLARIRHRNVLHVYGCAVHNGHPGMWSELIEGRTLAEILASDGALSAEEALRIGRDLAFGLAAIHAAGLVHGDVKAENAMREPGGRVILMDFGAGDEERLLAARRLVSGTPRYLPPEVLDGAPLSSGSDVYALGVLLFALLSGRFPYAETEPAALREAQRSGERLHLADLRPELDPRIVQLVERCLATDLVQRPRSAAEFGQLLEELLHPNPVPTPRTEIAFAAAGIATLAFAALALAWTHVFPPAWQADAHFLRIGAQGSETLAAGAQVAVGDHLRLHFSSNRASHVYVLNEDADGKAAVLFPLTAANDVTGVGDIDLPGGRDSTLAWEVTADSEREEFLVVAALDPMPELERALADWRHAARARSGHETRSVGEVVDEPGMPTLRGTHLNAVIDRLGKSPEQVRTWRFAFPHHR